MLAERVLLRRRRLERMLLQTVRCDDVLDLLASQSQEDSIRHFSGTFQALFRLF
jgi:hypothetical protein